MKTQIEGTPRRIWTGTLGLMILGLVFVAMPARDAEAAGHHHRHHHHHRSGAGIGFGVSSSAHYVPGHWEYRTEEVLVEPARTERVWVEPECKEVAGPDGKLAVVKVRDGFMKEVHIPARYESVTTRSWVPGYYASAPAAPRVSVGFGFRF